MLNDTPPYRNDYAADGLVTDYDFTFAVVNQTALTVYVNGAIQAINTDYRVRNGALPFSSLPMTSLPATGFIQFLESDGSTVRTLPSGALVTLLRSQPLQQQSDYVANESFPSERIERDLDKLAMIAQQTQETLTRCLHAPITDALSMVLPSVTARKSRILSFDTSGLPTVVDPAQSAGGDVSLATVIATGSVTARSLATREADTFNVKDYGAMGNSVTDDTTAIQAAFNAAATARVGLVLFPPGVYVHQGLTLAPASGQMHVNLSGLGGSGSSGVTLTYAGSGVGLTITNNTRYTVKNLRMLNSGTGTIGLLLNSLTTGSTHGPAWYENILIEGFTTNLQVGDTSNKAASELTFANLEVMNSTTGVLIQGPVSGTSFSTNIRFLGLQASTCGTVLVVAGDPTGTAIKLSCWNFSLSGNTLEFDFQVPGVYRLVDGYAEQTGDGQLIKSGSATAIANVPNITSVLIESVVLNYPSSPSNFLALFYQPGFYTIQHSLLQTGSIQLGGYDGGAGARKSHLLVEQSVIVSGSPTIAYKASSNTIWNVRQFSSGTTAVEAINTSNDRHYVITTSGTELDIATYGAWSASAGGAALKAALGTRIVATADLPAASSDLNGTLIIEDNGTGDRNLIIYAGGQRFRLDGGTAF